MLILGREIHYKSATDDFNEEIQLSIITFMVHMSTVPSTHTMQSSSQLLVCTVPQWRPIAINMISGANIGNTVL